MAAGNSAIQLLRCTSDTRGSSSETLLEGQPMYETDTGLFYVGDGVTAASVLKPITVPYATQTVAGGIKIWYQNNALYISTED